MNEQELSALIDELLSEKQEKHPAEDDAALREEETLAEELEALAEEAAEAADAAAHPAATAPLPAEPETETPTEAQEASPAHSPVPDAEERRGRLYAALNAQPETAAPKLPKQNYRTRDVIMGLLLVVLAAYGIYALVLRGIDRARALRDDTAKQDAVTACILPLVLTDMPEFADPSELTDDQFLTAAIWAAITQGKLAEYPQSLDMYTVPAETLVTLGNRLFGVNRSPDCHTIGFTGELRFYYDAEAKTYLLPADPELFTYEPVIRDMQNTADGQYLVTVDYAAEQPKWKTGDPAIVKTMQFTVYETESIWSVHAAQMISEQKEGLS